MVQLNILALVDLTHFTRNAAAVLEASLICLDCGVSTDALLFRLRSQQSFCPQF